LNLAGLKICSSLPEDFFLYKSIHLYKNSVGLYLPLISCMTKYQHTDKKISFEVLCSGIPALFLLFFSKKCSDKVLSSHLDKSICRIISKHCSSSFHVLPWQPHFCYFHIPS